MATAAVKYFSGTLEVKSPFGLDNAKFRAIGGVPTRHNRYDSFSRMAGHPATGPDAVLPITRTIYFKSHPSLHKCDSRCRSAKGHDCECSCGGQFHGADA